MAGYGGGEKVFRCFGALEFAFEDAFATGRWSSGAALVGTLHVRLR